MVTKQEKIMPGPQKHSTVLLGLLCVRFTVLLGLALVFFTVLLGLFYRVIGTSSITVYILNYLTM